MQWMVVGRWEEEKGKWKVVQYTTYDGVYVKCNCAMYETLGILCQHALYMLKKKKVMELSEHYILSRWTVSGRYRVGRTDAGTSQTGTTIGRPTQLDLWNLGARCARLTRTQRRILMM